LESPLDVESYERADAKAANDPTGPKALRFPRRDI
jgi:hypothetical protein